jgi:hypothetical protein
MAFPTKKPMGGAPAAGGLFDDPADEMAGPAHSEPDGDESLMNDLASKDI